MQLNAEQKEAVLHNTGPLLIIAGAGTGKTGVITQKILHLINEKLAAPSEILALTFTEKAALEMAERVDFNLPLGYEEIFIKTFHSFSESILRERAHEIGIDPSYSILTDTDLWYFFKSHLYQFDLDYYRPLGNPNKFIFNLLDHFGKLKEELITPESYIEYGEKLADEEKEKTLELAHCYKRYQELLIKNNYFDFADLTYHAIELLTRRKTVLNEYQTKFRYILIDEFQDTNFAQYILVKTLASSHKNICVVGDDDQSIYKWRGASLSNILNFQKDFPETKKIVLKQNYRSTKPVLDTAYALIQYNNPDRLEHKEGIDKKLVCNHTESGFVKINHFPNYLQETDFVINEIKSLIKDPDTGYRDIAILLRTNNQTYPFIQELKRADIPFQVKDPKGLLSLDEIKDILAVIHFLANPYDDVSLLRILKLPVFDIQMQEILKVLHAAKNDHLFNILIKESFNEDENLKIPGTESSLKDVLKILQNLIEFSKNNSVGPVITEFFKLTNYLNHLIENDEYEELYNINQFAQHVSRFEKDENHESSVIEFSKYIELLNETSSPLAYEPGSDRDSVQVLTAHSSKGLEFKYVFIANVVKQRFPSNKRSDPFKVPDEITREIYPEGDFHMQEERRLFYVSMTRAKIGLYITYSDKYEGKKDWKPSPFILEIKDNENTEFNDHPEKEDFVEKLVRLKEPKKTKFSLPEFKSKRLSYSQLDTFNTCPLKYSFRHIMKVPEPASHATSFGSSIHNTLNEFYQLIKNGDNPPFKTLEEIYKRNWISLGYESKDHENIRYDKGLKIMENFFEKNFNPWIVPAFLERPFNLKLKEYMINGRIDRIDKLKDGTYEVIDYKTGKNREKKLKSNLQLKIYALACCNVLNLDVSRLSLYFIEDNEKISIETSDLDLNGAADEIMETIADMKKSDFSPVPGNYCSFCDFKLICPAV